MLELNKKCKTCTHECVCEFKVLRSFYDDEVLGLYESFEDEFGENFDLVLECRHFSEAIPRPRTICDYTYPGAIAAQTAQTSYYGSGNVNDAD